MADNGSSSGTPSSKTKGKNRKKGRKSSSTHSKVADAGSSKSPPVGAVSVDVNTLFMPPQVLSSSQPQKKNGKKNGKHKDNHVSTGFNSSGPPGGLDSGSVRVHGAKMNLDALKRFDDEVLGVEHTCSHVTVYRLDSTSQQWAGQSIQGPLFIVSRSSAPKYRIMVLNRNTPQNLYVALDERFRFEVKENFFLYHSSDGHVQGLWIHELKELQELQKFMRTIQDDLKQSEASASSDSNADSDIGVLARLLSLPEDSVKRLNGPAGLNFGVLRTAAELEASMKSQNLNGNKSSSTDSHQNVSPVLTATPSSSRTRPTGLLTPAKLLAIHQPKLLDNADNDSEDNRESTQMSKGEFQSRLQQALQVPHKVDQLYQLYVKGQLDALSRLLDPHK